MRDRRRGGRDGAARHGVALEQVPQPGDGRRGPADPSPERLQDRQPDDPGADQPVRAREPAHRVRLPPVHRGGGRAGADAPGDGGGARRHHRGDPGDPVGRPGRRSAGASTLAGIGPGDPQGLDRAAEVDGKKTEGFWRSHQVPLAGLAEKPEHLRQLERWMRSYRPEELFDGAGRLRAELAALAPRGARRMGATRTPTAAFCSRTSACRTLRVMPWMSPRRASWSPRPPGSWAASCATSWRLNQQHRNFRVFSPDETASNRLDALFETTERTWMAERLPEDEHLAPERPGDGDPERAHLPGMARGLSPHGTAWPLLELRGLHPHRRFDVQPARQVAEGVADASVARADRLAQLPADVPRLASGQQWVLAPGPRIHRPRRQQEG